MESSRFWFVRHEATGHQRSHFGSKLKDTVPSRPTEWFDPEAVLGKKEFRPVRRTHIKNRKCEHPSKPLDDFFPPLLAPMQDRLRVGFGMERVTALHKLSAQFAKVIDFAVVD